MLSLTAFLGLTFSTVFLIWALNIFISGRRKRPPGPPRIPILGNLVQMAKAHNYGFRAFHKLSQVYGDIMSVRVGLQEMVVLSSYEVMQDLLPKDEISGRLWTGFLEDRSMGKELGIAFASGPSQHVLKQFVIRTLRQYGFGKQSSMESIVQSELEDVKQHLRNAALSDKGTVLMKRYFQPSLLNVLWQMMAAVRYDHEDPKLKKLLEINQSWMQTGNFGAGIVTAYPFVRFLFPEWTGYNAQKKGNAAIHEYLRDIIAEHRSRDGYETNPQSFIDVFLQEIDKNRNNIGSHFTDEQFMVICYDMFQGGFETTSNTLAFGMLYMMLNPDVQSKVQNELDSVLGKGVTPVLEDRERLTYTRAAMLEMFRVSNILPISGPRKTMRNFYYRDYFIGKGTAVTFNTYSVMQSKKIWGDPENFRPERFLDDNGQFNKKREYLNVLFGQGRRSCLGETLAQTTVWMYFSTILSNFSISCVPNTPSPTTEPVFGIILSPHPYEMVVKIRK